MRALVASDDQAMAQRVRAVLVEHGADCPAGHLVSLDSVGRPQRTDSSRIGGVRDAVRLADGTVGAAGNSQHRPPHACLGAGAGHRSQADPGDLETGGRRVPGSRDRRVRVGRGVGPFPGGLSAAGRGAARRPRDRRRVALRGQRRQHPGRQRQHRAGPGTRPVWPDRSAAGRGRSHRDVRPPARPEPWRTCAITWPAWTRACSNSS